MLSHKSCNPRSHSDFVPTRLLFVNSNKVALRGKDELPSGVQYATLSHCWGKNPMYSLLGSNHRKLSEEVPIERLSQVFCDAIALIRHLELSYIWIDSLCIIQDDRLDWEREAGRMGAVYKNSVCTIASTGFPDGEHGLFTRERDTRLLYPEKVEWKQEWDLQSPVRTGPCYLLCSQTWNRSISEAPLNKRAWVTQERVLSPRLLEFTADQVYWECCELTACEVFPRGVPKAVEMEDIERHGLRNRGLLRRILGHVDESNSIHESDRLKRIDPQPNYYMHRSWQRIVEHYSQTSLTYQSDRAVALSGLADECRRLTNDEYLCGLWKGDLIFQLLWSLKPTVKTSTRIHNMAFPSWSWLSVDAGVEYPDGKITKLLAYEPESWMQARSVRGATSMEGLPIPICGVLKRLRVHMHPERRPYPYIWRADLEDEKITRLRLDPDILDFDGPGFKSSAIAASLAQTCSQQPDDDAVILYTLALAEHHGEEPELLGLALVPTNNSRGEFKRIGLWSERSEPSFCLSVPDATMHHDRYKAREEDGRYTIILV